MKVETNVEQARDLCGNLLMNGQFFRNYFHGRAGTSMWLPRVEVPELQLSSYLHKPISAGEISGSQFVSGQQRCLCDC